MMKDFACELNAEENYIYWIKFHCHVLCFWSLPHLCIKMGLQTATPMSEEGVENFLYSQRAPCVFVQTHTLSTLIQLRNTDKIARALKLLPYTIRASRSSQTLTQPLNHAQVLDGLDRKIDKAAAGDYGPIDRRIMGVYVLEGTNSSNSREIVLCKKKNYTYLELTNTRIAEFNKVFNRNTEIMFCIYRPFQQLPFDLS